jgi:hypothetical protein
VHGQNRGCSWSTELAIVVSRRSRREISLWKAGDGLKERNEKQKERKAGGTVGGHKSSTDDTNALEERCLRDHV